MFQVERCCSFLIMIRITANTPDGRLSNLLTIVNPPGLGEEEDDLQFNTRAWPAGCSHAHCKVLPSLKSRITPICRQSKFNIEIGKGPLL